MPTTISPAIVRVHYRDRDDTVAVMAGALAATQYDGCIGLVMNEAAWDIPDVCRWQMSNDRIIRVEVIRPAVEELTPGEQILADALAAVAMTPGEQAVYDALASIGGPVQHRDIVDIVRYHGRLEHLEPYQVHERIQSLKAKGRITLTPSAGLDSGIVEITGQYVTQ